MCLGGVIGGSRDGAGQIKQGKVGEDAKVEGTSWIPSSDSCFLLYHRTNLAVTSKLQKPASEEMQGD